ncbi:hypothetical protein sos41_23030 [Alphaproteobacteria bacterium SO-S41]|nr:hypothetical protein sos41_23030 [Alphaproteobacteria bacterium SO-S41]
MRSIIIPYRVRMGLYLAAVVAFLALGALAVPLAQSGRMGPAVFAAAAAVTGVVFALMMLGRKRQVVVTPVSITVPGGPLATQPIEVLYRHIQSVHTDRKTGGAYLTIIHRSGTVHLPAACLPKDQGVPFLRDLIGQHRGETGQQARPISRTRAAVARPGAPVKRSFGKRAVAR